MSPVLLMADGHRRTPRRSRRFQKRGADQARVVSTEEVVEGSPGLCLDRDTAPLRGFVFILKLPKGRALSESR
jgi:hypothetical protein